MVWALGRIWAVFMNNVDVNMTQFGPTRPINRHESLMKSKPHKSIGNKHDKRTMLLINLDSLFGVR